MVVTMKQIANLAGVSIGTVDRALKNKGRVNEEVRQRILEIADRLGYKPNTVAKSLAVMKQNIKIAVILHVQGNLFFNQISKGIEEAANEIADFGIRVEVKKGADFDVSSQLALIEEVVAEEFNAMVIVPIRDEKIESRLQELSESGFPIVFLASDIPELDCLSYVGCDYRKAGAVAGGLVRLLCNSEQRRIAYITPALSLVGHMQRYEGFKKAIGCSGDFQIISVVETPNSDLESYKATKRLCEEHPDLDIVVLGSGSIYGCYNALEECGLVGNVLVIAFDCPPIVKDALLSDSIEATVVQHPQEEGYQAVKTIFEYLTANQKPSRRNHYIPCEIIIKESVAEIT